MAAREISELIWRQPGDEAFIAGLLQDIGMLLMMQEIGPLYGEFLQKTRLAGKDLAAMESEALGFDHAALSARLLAHWGLPDTLLEAVAYRPEADPAPRAGGPCRKSSTWRNWSPGFSWTGSRTFWARYCGPASAIAE